MVPFDGCSIHTGPSDVRRAEPSSLNVNTARRVPTNSENRDAAVVPLHGEDVRIVLCRPTADDNVSTSSHGVRNCSNHKFGKCFHGDVFLGLLSSLTQEISTVVENCDKPLPTLCTATHFREGGCDHGAVAKNPKSQTTEDTLLVRLAAAVAPSAGGAGARHARGDSLPRSLPESISALYQSIIDIRSRKL